MAGKENSLRMIKDYDIWVIEPIAIREYKINDLEWRGIRYYITFRDNVGPIPGYKMVLKIHGATHKDVESGLLNYGKDILDVMGMFTIKPTYVEFDDGVFILHKLDKGHVFVPERSVINYE
jgi:hypothetical protein